MQPMSFVYGVDKGRAGAVRPGSKYLAEFRLGVAVIIIC